MRRRRAATRPVIALAAGQGPATTIGVRSHHITATPGEPSPPSGVSFGMTRIAALAAGAVLLLLLAGETPAEAADQQQQARPQRGTASFYAQRFHGRRMANGRRFDAGSRSAAHRTLPLGTTARVTNLGNGRTTEVKVEDRGPYVGNRVIDLSPRTAGELGMREQGTAEVRVQPLHVPDRD
jgi:rare lipoprotein A